MQAVVGSIKSSVLVHSQPAVYDAQFNYINIRWRLRPLLHRAISGMGLTLPGIPAAGLPYDAPTPEGRAVAAPFRAAVADTTYYREYFDNDHAEVPAEVVAEYIRAGCLCQLRTPSAPDRQLLQDVFLHAGGTRDAAQRRSTIRMLPTLPTRQRGTSCPRTASAASCTSDSTGPGRCSVGTGSCERADGSALAALPDPRYYAYALNRMWRYLAEWGIAEVRMSGGAVPLATWWSFVDDALDFGPLAAALDVGDSGLTAARRWRTSPGGRPRERTSPATSTTRGTSARP